MTKAAMFTMKLERDLHADFMAEAKASHRPASQVLRELMRDFVQRQRDARAHDVFVERKVAVARAAAADGQGRAHDSVTADFAVRRADALGKA